MKIKSKEIAIINLCIPHLTEFGEINFAQISVHLAAGGVTLAAESLAAIFMKNGFCYSEDCVTITGDIVFQYFLTESGRMLFNARSYEHFVAVREEETHKRKIRLSRSNPKDWLDTKFIRAAAFVLFAIAVYSFALGDRKMGNAPVQNENNNPHMERLKMHSKPGLHK